MFPKSSIQYLIFSLLVVYITNRVVLKSLTIIVDLPTSFSSINFYIMYF